MINGGIKQAEESKIHLSKVDGIMLGRVAYQNPMALSDFENKIFNRKKITEITTFYCGKVSRLHRETTQFRSKPTKIGIKSA